MTEEINTDLSSERLQIRENLSNMSFEELMKLKEKMGSKLYSETVFGESAKGNTKRRSAHPQMEYKRANKNRPREMSAKRPTRIKNELLQVKKIEPRDPRFDPLCGSYNEQEFKKSYKFIDQVKMNELKMLKEELKETEDPKRVVKIKYLIQRLDNQLKDIARKDKEHEKLIEEKKEIKEKIKSGEKPEYKKKSEKKMLDLLSQYEELKESKKLKKHIEKRSKKEARKDFKKMKTDFN